MVEKQDIDVIEKLRQTAKEISAKEKLNQGEIARLREEQYEDRTRRAGL